MKFLQAGYGEYMVSGSRTFGLVTVFENQMMSITHRSGEDASGFRTMTVRMSEDEAIVWTQGPYTDEYGWRCYADFKDPRGLETWADTYEGCMDKFYEWQGMKADKAFERMDYLAGVQVVYGPKHNELVVAQRVYDESRLSDWQKWAGDLFGVDQ